MKGVSILNESSAPPFSFWSLRTTEMLVTDIGICHRWRPLVVPWRLPLEMPVFIITGFVFCRLSFPTTMTTSRWNGGSRRGLWRRGRRLWRFTLFAWRCPLWKAYPREYAGLVVINELWSWLRWWHVRSLTVFTIRFPVTLSAFIIIPVAFPALIIVPVAFATSIIIPAAAVMIMLRFLARYSRGRADPWPRWLTLWW